MSGYPEGYRGRRTHVANLDPAINSVQAPQRSCAASPPSARFLGLVKVLHIQTTTYALDVSPSQIWVRTLLRVLAVDHGDSDSARRKAGTTITPSVLIRPVVVSAAYWTAGASSTGHVERGACPARSRTTVSWDS